MLAWFVVLRVRCPGPLDSCSLVRLLDVLCCVQAVLGHLAPVQRCVRLVCCFVCAVSWANWLLFTGVPAGCVALCLRCPGPLGSCSPVRPFGALLCLCGVLGHLAPVHPCARVVRLVACAVSWATWLLFTGAPARCVSLCVGCNGSLGSCSPVCPLGVLLCVCRVLGHLAPVHRCAWPWCPIPLLSLGLVLPYPAPKEQADEIERQIQECIDAGLVLEYKDGDYPQHCRPCFLVAKPGSTAYDYEELNKKTLNHSGSIPNMESTLEKKASCRYRTKMDKRSGFWQVDLTPKAQELLAFITPQGRVFKWKVMPFGVANAPALFQELMNKILSILRRRPKVQELISRGAQMEAHIDDVCLGTNTQEDHLILLGEFFAVCEENHTRLKLEKCEFMQETMRYLGFDVGYGWWTPAASKAKPLMDAKVRHEDPKKGLHDVRSFIGACNFYRRYIKNFTYTSAILTDLIKKSTTWR